jgi:F420-0:gamma-glutamyl ligase
LQILEAAEREGVEVERQKGRFLVDAATDSEEAETVWGVPVDEDPSSSLETICMKLVAVLGEDVAVDLIPNLAWQT